MCGARRVVWCAGLVVLAVACGCGHPTTAIAPVAPTLVTVSRPIEQQVTDFVDITGRTEAVESVDVRARVSGYLKAIHFKPGQLVKKGDLLFEIDPRPYQAELDRAAGDVARNEALLTRLNAEFNRASKLLPTRAISQEDYDVIVGNVGETKAAIQSAMATVARAKLDLDFTQITAPIDGMVSRELITAGNLVSADVTLLTSIRSVNPMNVYFDMDERTVLDIQELIREGKVQHARDSDYPVYLGLANQTGFPHVGRIDFVDNRVDPTTGTLRLRAVFDNADGVLYPGLFARIRVPVGEPHQALMVTERALGIDQGQRYLMLVGSDDKVEQRYVSVGQLRDGLRVISSGIAPGDRVIVDGLQRVRSGSQVTCTEVDMVSFVSAPATASTASAEAPMATSDATHSESGGTQDK